MAAGDRFTTLLNQSDPPVEPLSDEPGILEQSAAAMRMQKGKAALGGPTGGPDPSSNQVMRDAAEASYWQGEDTALSKRRANERAGLHAGEHEQAVDEARIAKYGTADPLEAAQKEASGIFGQNLPALMRIDPEGTAAKVQREVLQHESGA